MRLVLTGATGLLGNNIARMACEIGWEVICPVRRSGDRSLLDVPVTQVPVDFSPGQDWKTVLDGADAVVHSAALIHIGWHQQAESYRVNVEVTRELAETAWGLGQRFVHISTVDTLAYSPDGTPISEGMLQPEKPASAYVKSKKAAEAEIDGMARDGLDAIIIHPGFMLGPWDWKPSSGKMLQAIAHGKIPLAPRGGCSAVDVRDVARGVINAAEKAKSGEHYIMAGHNVSYRELFAHMGTVVGRRPPRGTVGPVVAWVAGKLGDLGAALTGKESDLNSALVQMGQLRHFYSSEKAEHELGYRISPLVPAIESAWKFLASLDQSAGAGR